ncbi:MAG: ABC transporter permease subunit [Candidatus Berkelbacteria bacterium]|nr:ABC transporter permease subunit [Candidatus Berkelbacteria bacterium]
MNLFFREMKSYRNSLFFWSLGMIALVAAGFAKYAAYQGTGQPMTAILDQFSKSMQAIFGINGFDISKMSGFYGVMFMYFALMATVHAVIIGTDIIGKEERDRTSEFLMVKPISRSKIIFIKLFAGLINLIVLNIVTLFSSLYFVNYFGKGVAITKNIETLMIGLFALQLIFFFAGTAIAAISKKQKTAPSTATFLLLITFVLSIFININTKLDWLKYLTPFRYFDARNLLSTGFEPLYLTIATLAVAIFILVTFRSFQKRDLSI